MLKAVDNGGCTPKPPPFPECRENNRRGPPFVPALCQRFASAIHLQRCLSRAERLSERRFSDVYGEFPRGDSSVRMTSAVTIVLAKLDKRWSLVLRPMV